MSERKYLVLRETILRTSLSPSELRRTLFDFKPIYIRKVLWLTESTYLSIAGNVGVTSDGSINSDDLATFALKADLEIQDIGRVAAVIANKDFTVSALLEKFLVVFDANGSVFYINPKGAEGSSDPNVPVLFKWSAVGILSKRLAAVRMFFEANASRSQSRRFTEYFRVIEAGFGLRGSRLQKPVIAFLSKGNYSITIEKWQEIKALRDRLSHAYDADSLLFEADAGPLNSKLQAIAADILVHKLNWGVNDVIRIDEDNIALSTSGDGTVLLSQGYPLSLTMQVTDPVTGIPMHLAPQEHNMRYRRYADLYFKIARCFAMELE